MEIRVERPTADTTIDAVVALRGSLVVGTRQALHEAVEPMVADGVRRVLIDFRDTDYVDSTGLATLASLARLLRGKGGTLEASGMIEPLRNACALGHLDGVMTHRVFDGEVPIAPAPVGRVVDGDGRA